MHVRMSDLVVFMTALILCVELGATALPRFEEVQRSYAPSESVLLDRNGIPISEVRRDPKARRLAWVAMHDLSPALQSALVASEDRRFFAHGGVDWQAFAGALWDNLWRNLQGRRPRGASTLTMQLAGLLDPSLRAKGQARTLAQKWDQALAAQDLERNWSKQQIIEAYLNLATFRGELQGVHAASRALFGKHPAGIDEREALLLSALLRGPNATPQRVAQRACAVAAKLPEAPGCAAIHDLAVASLSGRNRTTPQHDSAPHLARMLLKHPGETVRSTLVATLQQFAINALRNQLAELGERSVEDGAVVVVENASGDVMAYVGSNRDLSGVAEFDGIAAAREASAMLKPFLYQLALEKRLLTAASILDDSPVGPVTPARPYPPYSNDQDFNGPVTVRTALGSSLDLPTVHAWALVGHDAFYERLRSLGFSLLTRVSGANANAYSFALGLPDVTLLQITNAFRALANGGEWSDTRVTHEHGETDNSGARKRIMRADATYIIADVLSDRAARAPAFGMENPLATRVWTAVTIGTGKDMRDAWCVGFSDRYTVGVWLGNLSPTPIPGSSALTGAAPIWRNLMDFLHADLPSIPPRVPPGVVSRIISFEPPVEAARKEWFITGTETLRVEISAPAKPVVAAPRIAYPTNVTVITLDPDNPDGHQRMTFQSRPAISGLSWRLNGEILSRGVWLPRAGRHRLELVDASGQAIDAVNFEVQGSAAAANSHQPSEQRSE